MEKNKKKRKFSRFSIVCLLASILVVFGMIRLVVAFQEYEVTQSNDFQIEVKQKKASSSSGTKYATGGWYLFQKEIGAADSAVTPDGKTINSSYYNTYGIKLTTGAENRVHRTEEDANGVFYDTFQFDAEDIIPAILTWYTKDGVIDRESLIDGITVYASRSLNVVVDGKVKSTHYHYEDIAKQAGWSSGTLNAFKDSYDKPLQLQFNATDFSIEVIEEEGTIPEGYENTTYEDIPNQLLYGESVSYYYPGEIIGYEYIGFEWRVGSSSGTELKALTKANATGNYRIVYSEEVEENGLVLVFRYAKIPPPATPTPTPTNTPIPTPTPTLVPGITATPTPLPTNTPTPLPTATPAPTSLPTKDVYIVSSEEYYFSTDKGYTMHKIANSSSYMLCSEKSSTGSGDLGTSSYTKRDKSYTKGTDAQGNTWYFIPDGTNATYVHPAIYQGYSADGEQIKYITELIFPSTLTYEGNSYTVISIGGGTPKYKTEKEKYEEKWVESTGFGYYEDSNYGIISGIYDYYRYTGDAAGSYTVDYNNQISYVYGVLGNGKIESYGSTYREYTNDTVQDKYYNRNYYVYNTTLEVVVIPETVIQILPYAFYGCQALSEIRGAESVTMIGDYSFQAINPILRCSSEWVENSYKSYDRYYYNESYSTIEDVFTDTMLQWKEECQLSPYLKLSKFPVLDIIGLYAFERRNNLYDVVLSNTVTSIGTYAFRYCALNSITIPSKQTNIKIPYTDPHTTLGTNGAIEERTMIYTVPYSKAMEYGLAYAKYYRLKSGYSVIYESNGAGQGSRTYPSEVIIEEDTMSFIATICTNLFTREGYQFTGWNTKADGTGVSYLPNAKIALTEELTLYAQWKKEPNRIRYNKNGGVGTMIDTVVEPEVTSVYLSKNQFTRTGYVFTGWNTKADGTGRAYEEGAYIINLSGTITVYAQWKELEIQYTLVYMEYPLGTVNNKVWKQKKLTYRMVETVEGAPFAAKGSKVQYNINMPSNSSVSPNPLNLTEKNTTIEAPAFDNWKLYTKKNDGTFQYAGKQYNIGSKVSKLTTEEGAVFYLYPKWKEEKAYVLLPYTMSEGYILEGWSESIHERSTIYEVYGAESEEDIATFTPIKDTTLYGVWNPKKKTVTLDGQQATEQIQREIVITFDTIAPKVEIPKRSRYVFYGYYTKPEGTGIQVINKDGVGTIITNNVTGCFDTIDTLYAYWIPDKSISYEPNYAPLDKDCPTMEMTWIEAEKTGTYLSKNKFTKTGYYFQSWNTKADGTGTIYNDGQYVNQISGRIILYAQWEANDYTLTFHANGGWFDGKKEIITKQAITTYDTGKYHNVAGFQISKTGYTFTGWYLDAACTTLLYDASGVAVNDGTYWNKGVWKYTGDVTLYAGWTANSYTLTINENKGTGSTVVTTPYRTVKVTFDSKTHHYNGINHEDYLAGNIASRQGYDFIGYFSASSNGTKLYDTTGKLVENGTIIFHNSTTGYYFYQGKYKVEGNITLYAQWKPKTYQIQLNLNDAGAIPKAELSYDKIQIVFDTAKHQYGTTTTIEGLQLNLPKRAGYEFEGWYTSATGGTKVYHKDGSIVNDGTYFKNGVYVYPKDITLYAHWKAISGYELCLEGNKGTGSTEVTIPYPKVIMTFDSVLHYYGGKNHNNYLTSNLAYRTGYVFQGYDTSASGGIRLYQNTGSLSSQTITDVRVESLSGYYFYSGMWKVVGNLTLYAQWKPKTYTVILNDRGATSTNHTQTVTLTFDETGPEIIVPTKTGYTFQGYYTEIRGNGTCYYDKTGTAIKSWTEDNKDTLYAYWIQNEIKLPEEGDRIEPTPLPEKEIIGEIMRKDGKALLYAEDYVSTTGATTDLQPYLTYDTPADTGAIPSTEQVALRAQFGSYILNYKFHRYTGTDYVRIYVNVPYRTQYELSNEELVISQQQQATYSFVVPKVWSYWAVLESGMYYPDALKVTNDVIEQGEVTVAVNLTEHIARETPSYAVKTYGDKKAHITWDTYDTDGMPMLTITLTEEQYIISNVVNQLPDIKPHLMIVCGNAAWTDVRQANGKSDSFVFNDTVVLSDAITTTGNGKEIVEENLPIGEEIIENTYYEQTYQSGISLIPTKANGCYESVAVITYKGDTNNVGVEETKSLAIEDINDIRIHTPVACNGVVVDGIEEYVLTLKDVLNFFTLKIENIGTHLMKLGYGHRNFLTALSGISNVAKEQSSYLNQVCFPFDVYVDMGNDTVKEGNDYDTTGDYYVKANTWLTMSDLEKRFYLPASQKDGEYDILFRTIAINCPKSGNTYITNGTMQKEVNTNPACYIATDSMRITIKLAVSDFDIVNTNDPTAKKQLLDGKQALTLKKGYKFAYKIKTVGTFLGEDAKVEIIPKYYYISKDGSERTEVEVYYNEVIDGKKQNFVKVGSQEDTKNFHIVKNNSTFLSIPQEVLINTQQLLGDKEFIGTPIDMYTFQQISLNRFVRMFPKWDFAKIPINYCTICHVVYPKDKHVTCGHTVNETILAPVIEKIIQEWYGEFSIPMTSYVIAKNTMVGYCNSCKKDSYLTEGETIGCCGHVLTNKKKFDFDVYTKQNTISGTEEFLKKEGYLAVSFEIQGKADSNQWYRLEDWENTRLAKEIKGKRQYVEGDVIWYDLSKSSGEDYEVGGVE